MEAKKTRISRSTSNGNKSILSNITIKRNDNINISQTFDKYSRIENASKKNETITNHTSNSNIKDILPTMDTAFFVNKKEEFFEFCDEITNNYIKSIKEKELKKDIPDIDYAIDFVNNDITKDDEIYNELIQSIKQCKKNKLLFQQHMSKLDDVLNNNKSFIKKYLNDEKE